MKKVLTVILFVATTFCILANPVTEQVEHPERIVSGYYISTSACIALGLKDNLVAIEAQADKRPIYKLAAPELIELPNVGTAKSFNLEACLSVKPDLVILSQKQKDSAKALEELGIKTIVVNPESHEEIEEMFKTIGEATGHEKEAQTLIDRYENILDIVKEKASHIDNKPVVYICGTGSYLKTAPREMYQANLIELAGGINAGSAIEGGSRVEVSYEQLLSFNPDIIIVPTNSNANGTPDFTVDDILSDPILADISAVETKSVYQMPIGLESWDSPVPSGALGVLWMLHIIHPELCSETELKQIVNYFYKDLYNFDAGY